MEILFRDFEAMRCLRVFISIQQFFLWILSVFLRTINEINITLTLFHIHYAYNLNTCTRIKHEDAKLSKVIFRCTFTMWTSLDVNTKCSLNYFIHKNQIKWKNINVNVSFMLNKKQEILTKTRIQYLNPLKQVKQY